MSLNICGANGEHLGLQFLCLEFEYLKNKLSSDDNNYLFLKEYFFEV